MPRKTSTWSLGCFVPLAHVLLFLLIVSILFHSIKEYIWIADKLPGWMKACQCPLCGWHARTLPSR